MPHIHTKSGQHDLTASALIIRLDGPEPQLILHFHKKLKLYIQFGGHVELNETPWQAIIHELKEESGYDIGQLKVLQPKDRLKELTGSVVHPIPLALITHSFGGLDHFHTDTTFAFTAIEAPRHGVGDGESTDTRLYTARELAAAPEDSVPKAMKEFGKHLFDTVLNTWDEVSPSRFE